MLAPANQAIDSVAVVMDTAGDAVVVWEPVLSYNCAKADCAQDSLGVFAALRPAGGSFGPAVRLSAKQPGVQARPQVAMNRAGDWIVAMSVAGQTVVGAGRRATPPDGFAALPLPSLHDGALAIDEAGNTTFGGTDAANHPATIVRRADGSFGELTVLDDASLLGRGIAIAVGPQATPSPSGREAASCARRRACPVAASARRCRRPWPRATRRTRSASTARAGRSWCCRRARSSRRASSFRSGAAPSARRSARPSG